MGERCRETLNIPATASNIKYAERLRGEILNAIERKSFEYSTFFPDSPKSKRLAPPVAHRPLLNDMIEAFIDQRRKTKSMSPTSISCYQRWANARLLPKFEGKYADELTTPELRTWVAELATELAPKSVRNCVGVLSSVLSQAAVDGVLKHNPLTPIKLKTLLPKRTAKERDRVDPFNTEEIAAILRTCENDQERALFQFAFATGLRTGELIALKWPHINWLEGLVHVCENIVPSETGMVEKSTKTDEERDVPILPAAMEALQAMKRISYLGNTEGFVFLHQCGKRWQDDHQIRNRWKTILRRAGVRYRNPYQTRHTFASTLLMNGEPELLVAKLLGHATVEMVRKIYGRYIKQPNGIQLRGDYSQFGADLGQSAPPKPALSGNNKKSA